MSESARIRREMGRATELGLLEAAHEIKRRSDNDIPVGEPSLDPDPGVSIKDSGYIHVLLGGRVVEIGYTAPYSAKQHEDQHLKHPRGGKAKFLEDAVKAELPRLERIIAGEVHKRVQAR